MRRKWIWYLVAIIGYREAHTDRERVVMKRVAAVLATAIAGCVDPAVTASINELHERDRKTTLASGWRVDCNEDHHRGIRNCFAAPKSRSFQVAYVNGDGPMLVTSHTDPSREATVRVDSGKVHRLTNINEYLAGSGSAHIKDARAAIRDMRAGKVVYIVSYHWPDWMPKRAKEDLTGFQEAHDMLLKKVASLE